MKLKSIEERRSDDNVETLLKELKFINLILYQLLNIMKKKEFLSKG